MNCKIFKNEIIKETLPSLRVAQDFRKNTVRKQEAIKFTLAEIKKIVELQNHINEENTGRSTKQHRH
jgi:hypothetical protein